MYPKIINEKVYCYESKRETNERFNFRTFTFNTSSRIKKISQGRCEPNSKNACKPCKFNKYYSNNDKKHKNISEMFKYMDKIRFFTPQNRVK